MNLNFQGVHTTETMKTIKLSLQTLLGVKSVEISPNGDKVVLWYDPNLKGLRCFIERSMCRCDLHIKNMK